MMEGYLWSALAILSVATALTTMMLVRARRRFVRQVEAEAAARVDAAAAYERISIAERHQREVLHRQWMEYDATLHAVHNGEIEKVRRWAATGMRWEANSRDRILAVAEELGLDGFVGTNVCFRAVGRNRSYVHQIDHLLVSQKGVLVIDSKNWNGLIFHPAVEKGNSIARRIERFELLRGLSSSARYVLHVRPEERPTVLRDNSPREPVKQVRTQAKALSRYLALSGMHKVPFIATCVYYSHPGSILVNGSFRDESTHVVDGTGLKSALAAKRDGCDDQVIRWLAAWTARYGADVHGLGRYRDQFRSAFPDLEELTRDPDGTREASARS